MLHLLRLLTDPQALKASRGQATWQRLTQQMNGHLLARAKLGGEHSKRRKEKRRFRSSPRWELPTHYSWKSVINDTRQVKCYKSSEESWVASFFSWVKTSIEFYED